jgi:hypothetical protein
METMAPRATTQVARKRMTIVCIGMRGCEDGDRKGASERDWEEMGTQQGRPRPTATRVFCHHLSQGRIWDGSQ